MTSQARLNALQKLLQRIYGIEVALDVDDFLITDPDLARELDSSHNARDVKEKLLISQQGDDVHLALYLEGSIIDHLAEDDPLTQLHPGNFSDFLLALEGVSHFLYLTWNAAFEKSVSLLELEMQAEVDKYVSAASLLGKQRHGRIPPTLRYWLFEAHAFDSALDQRQLERYRHANRYAGKYCLQLEKRYLRNKKERQRTMIRELRRFYRLPQTEKMRLIDNP